MAIESASRSGTPEVSHGSGLSGPARGIVIGGLLLASLLLAVRSWPNARQVALTEGLVVGLWLAGSAPFLWARRGTRGLRQAFRETDERHRVLIEGLKDHAIYALDPQGHVLSWDAGAQRLIGYAPQEIIGQHVSRMYLEQDRKQGKPQQHLLAAEAGRFEFEDWRLRKDGSCFWANVVIVSLCDEKGKLRGFCHVTRDQTQKKQLELLEADRRQVLEMVAQNQPLDNILERLIQAVERQYPEAVVTLLLVRNGQGQLIGRRNLPATLAEAMTAGAEAMTTALERSHRYAHGSVIVRGALAEDGQAMSDLELEQGLQCSLQIPVSNGSGQILGLFTSYYLEPHEPDSAETDLLKTVAKLAAIAVEHRQLTDQLAHQAHHDPLTELPNRMLMDDRMRQAMSQATRIDRTVGLLFIDLDRFKEINDTLGHEAGDKLLREVTGRFKAHVRQSDTLARMGGDEFTILLPDLHDRKDALRVAHKILAALELPFNLAGHDLLVSASVGVAVFPEDGADAAALLKNADMAMYRAKRSGRNRIECFAQEMHAAAMEKLVLEEQLRGSLERNEFELHFQPQVDRQGQVTGMEALVRWNHPSFGQVAPGRFIPLAEDSGFILPLGAWILREACRQNKTWQDMGYVPLRVAVNVSPMQFVHPDFLGTLTHILAASGLDARFLELELTESLLVQDTGSNLEKLARIRAMGIGVAIDDFGTGYSSLAYLQQLPIDTLKIDLSFIRSITSTQNDAPVVRAITSMAHSLGMKVVAEGVETEPQRRFLDQIGCDGMQGFLIARPGPPSTVTPFLRRDPAASEALLSAPAASSQAGKQVA